MNTASKQAEVMRGSPNLHNVRSCHRCREVEEVRHMEEAEQWAKEACDRIFSHYPNRRLPR